MDAIDQVSAVTNGRTVLSALKRAAVPQVAVLAIIALALGLRLYGLNWDRGYPHTPHPDERAILMRVGEISPPALGDLDVLLDADESPWNPRWFPYGSFPLYLLKGVQLVYSQGPWDELNDLRLAGRAISALADVATVLMVFLLAGRVYGRRVGVLASLLAALAVIHIQLSHFFAVDTLLALFSVVAVYFMYGVARHGRPRDSVLAGAFVGLGLATKVSLAPIYAAFVVAHLMYATSAFGGVDTAPSSFSERWRRSARGLAAGAGVSLAVLFVVQPYTFLDWGRFYDNVIEQSEMVRRIRDYPYTRQYIDTTPYWYQVRQLATWGLGWPLGLVAWAGLLYASLRGMRWRFGLAYLGVGWGLPIAILLISASFLSIFAASGIALAALLATLPFRSRESRADVLMLSWVVPYFLIIGAFQVKFLRYLIPITPFLLLFGSRMLFALWDGARTYRPALRPWLVAGLVLLVGSTGFYALSYMGVYRQPHTAVRASQWINENVPKGSVILKEHWEEGIPNLVGYQFRELPMYDDDTPRKVQNLADELARGDYLVFFSNRLYGTIPRLPERYPISGEYYRMMLSGQLGYELVDFEATYPELLGVGFVDDTFRRPDVPEPDGLDGIRPSPFTLGLGFADESFSVYDHPKVLILRNVERYDAGTIRRAIEEAAPAGAYLQRSVSERSLGLMLSPQDAVVQQSGGTWTEIVRPDSWTNRFSVLSWLILVQVMALLAVPITFVVFRPLPDRGYLFSKALGLLVVGLMVWLLASLEWMAFSRASIGLAILLLALVSALVLARRRREIVSFVRKRWPILLIGEAVFLLAFFSFLVIRMANPDLWHPIRGGEKPMDFAYLNAVLRSSYMPPYDPWFGGGYINYYYWGQFMVAMLIKATGIRPDVAFNLAVPLFFALTAGGAFAVVYNLAEGTRRRLQASGSGSDSPLLVRQGSPERSRRAHHERMEGEAHYERMEGQAQGSPSTGSGPAGERGVPWSPVLAGVGGALFVTVLGNLDGAIQVGRGVWRAMFRSLPFGEFDFYGSSRMMPTEVQGITEFPFFTFLFADLHAHLMALPFTLLALGLALAVIMAAARNGRRRAAWSTDEIVRLAVLGVAVGSLRLINAWDFPTYLIVGVAAVFLAEFYVHGGLGLGVVARAGVKSAFVFAVGYLVFLPFHLSYETSVNGLESTTNTTVLWRFLGISGLFVFIIGSFFVSESRDWLMAPWRAMRRGPGWFVRVRAEASPGGARRLSIGWVAVTALAASLVGYVVVVIFSGVVGSTIPFVAVLLALVLVAGVRWLFQARADSPYLAFMALIVGMSLALVMGLDIFRVELDIDRMNSVFKFYLQVWVMLALASAYFLWRLAQGRRGSLRRLAWGKKLWLGALAVLIISASVYPVLGTRDRLRVRFNDQVIPLTLDGAAYIDGTVYHGQKGDIVLAADYEGIEWLRDNVEGSPIILEGFTPFYRWGSRVSIYTGLPTVVGWQWHQQQQRWDYQWAVNQRVFDVGRIYATTSPSEALSLLREYGVKYVYVGQLERLYYPGPGLRKFDEALSGDLDKVFENGHTAIYRVRDGPGGPGSPR